MQWLTIELTSRCNKACSFCGRAKARKEGLLKEGDMPFETFELIVDQLRPDSIIQFNKDGEPLLYPYLGKVGELTETFTTNIVTNGKLLMVRKDEIMNNFDTVCVSVIEDDGEQFDTVKNFVESVGFNAPRVYIKFLGDYHNPEYEKLGLKTLRRTIHNPEGDTGYQGSKPPIPELGICLDFLYKPALDWEGRMHICNRYDPDSKGVLGDVHHDTLSWLWHSPLRQEWLEYHQQNRRGLVPLCKSCEFWGIPTS